MGCDTGEASRRRKRGRSRSSLQGSNKEQLVENLAREPRAMHEWCPTSPWDPSLLTIDPSSHLSHRAVSGIKDESVKGYGGVISVKHVWENVPVNVKAIVTTSCFEPLLRMALSFEGNKRVIVRGLIELFWDTTNTFHIPLFEMMVTPLDFSMLTGVLFGGDDIVYDRNFRNETEILKDMYGAVACDFPKGELRNVSYSVFSGVFDDDALVARLSDDQLARCFITYLLSSTIFADKSNKTWFHYLPCLQDLHRMGEYNWGAAGYANFVQQLRRASRVNDTSDSEHYPQVTIGGLWNILEVWFYEYFPSHSPGSTRRLFPASCRWAKNYQETRGSSRMADVNSLRDVINEATIESLCLSPWAESSWVGFDVPARISVARDLVKRRVLLRGPFGYVWYLGERVSAQYSVDLLVPVDPPPSMFQLNSPVSPSMIADLYKEQAPSDTLITQSTDYASFRQLRLAPPILRCEVRTQVTLPEARVETIGPNGEHIYVDIPELTDSVEGLPFPPDFKGFNRADSEKLWRLLQSSRRRVAELTSFVNLWSSIPKVSFGGSNPSTALNSVAGPVHFPSRLSELERMLSLNSGRDMTNDAPRTRGVSKKRRVIIESDSEGDA